MQTWLPHPNFRETAKLLDRQRLGKQRIEGWMLLRILSGDDSDAGVNTWRHHPVVPMWRGHEFVLLDYTTTMCDEWIQRGYRDTTLPKCLDIGANEIRRVMEQYDKVERPLWSFKQPPWLGDEALHRAYRLLLLDRNFEHYGHFWPELEGETLPTKFPFPKGDGA